MANITRTIYTDEMVRNAQYNVKHYDWAKKMCDELKKDADYFLEHFETLYDLLPAEGIPRSYKNSTLLAQDDVKCHCPNCGIHIDKEYGDWNYDPVNEPWKIRCPHCDMRFPTNDFALLYKRGLNEEGVYKREIAYENNKAAVARGEKDALVNELYPEKGELWMVDDGFGWSPSSGTYGTKDLIQFAPVAKFNLMLWHGGAPYSMRNVMTTLRDYYLYTGDEKYGRAGTVLLDRIADLYPDYDLTKIGLNYHQSHGGGYSGKIVGGIAEYYGTEIYVRCFDAFRPLYFDPEVIAFLSRKAKELGLKNPKTTGEQILKNCEDGILYAVWDGIKTAKVYGNFGLHQKDAVLTAVALDRQPITDEILDWVCAPHTTKFCKITDPVFGLEYESRCENTGGEMLTKYANEIDRDGFGAEISISYNHYWFSGAVIASILKNYPKSKLDLYKNPKVRRMFDTFIRMTVGGGHSLLFGDGGACGEGKLILFEEDMIRGYNDLRDPRIAQIFNVYAGGVIDSEKLGIFTDVEAIKNGIQKDIETHGEYEFISENMTGYGLAIVRGGEVTKEKDTRYDTWMYYGRTLGSHAHLDNLHMGIDAYGFNYTPDFGNPEFKSFSANRHEWIRNTIAHNAVSVDRFGQKDNYTGWPIHFDASKKVKVIDTECNEAYKQTDIYRRTLVTIEANDEVAYTLDFFRVKGGDRHTYSFHSQSYMGYKTEDLDLVPQVDENGNYVGTYAGPDVPYGPDPNSRDDRYAEDPKYIRGYTWLTNVNRGKNKTKDGVFAVDFKQSNFQSYGKDATDLYMKFHGLNTWEADSIDIVTGYAPRIPKNKQIPGLDYMFIQRTGKDLDTLFTSLMEPYKKESYILKATPIEVQVKEGTEGAFDMAKAVKVVLKSGRTDYVIYATNRDVAYCVVDGDVSFDFKGFVGVYSVDENGKNVYSYLNDGTLLGDMTSVGAYTGKVVDFTKELVEDNYIIISLDQEIEDISVFENQYIYVDNKGAKCNGSYRILSAKKDGENIALFLGNSSIIERYVDDYDLSKGFLYTIKEGQNFRIPVSEIKA